MRLLSLQVCLCCWWSWQLSQMRSLQPLSGQHQLMHPCSTAIGFDKSSGQMIHSCATCTTTVTSDLTCVSHTVKPAQLTGVTTEDKRSKSVESLSFKTYLLAWHACFYTRDWHCLTQRAVSHWPQTLTVRIGTHVCSLYFKVCEFVQHLLHI